MGGQHFRAGVVVVVRHPDGHRVLAFERVDTPGAWQLPQGGLDEGESPVQAARRELQEETGLGDSDVDLVAEYPEWLAYAWPPEIQRNAVRAKPNRLGQVQRWFLFDAAHVNVTPTPDGREFGAWRWADPQWLVDQVVEFRRPAYVRVLTAWTG